jgi:hypothetical protein
MIHWEITHSEIRDGFKVELAIAPEDKPLTGDFESEAHRQETVDRIDNGDLLWFVARVTASRQGVVLGTDYLGGCCYDNVQEFLRDAYYEGMVEEALGDARRMIEKLEMPEAA